MDSFYAQKMHLDEFLEHEVVFEYEKAMDQLFDDTMRPKKVTKKKDINDDDTAQFHPVFLSSLLNQTVFLGDVQEQKYKDFIKDNYDITKFKEKYHQQLLLLQQK